MKISKTAYQVVIKLVVTVGSFIWIGSTFAQPLTPEQQLGKSIFFDKSLSINQNQSCSTCHGPEAGWTGPDQRFNIHGAVYEGSIKRRFGNRKPPSAAYASLSPIFYYDESNALFLGGNFWDGRATGEKLGNPAADQAQGPFLNPVEQALPDKACVVYRVCNPDKNSNYPVVFSDVWGSDACDIGWPKEIEKTCSTEGGMITLSSSDQSKVDEAYDNIGITIADYESSREVNAFSSKFDLYLAKKVSLNKNEQLGLKLFETKGKCTLCHIINSNEAAPFFTDFSYDNLGIPKNPENPVYQQDSEFVDLGLGGFLSQFSDESSWKSMAEENYGKHKVPTLRNVGKRPHKNFVKAYGHNGYFKSLLQIVHFYNTRDVKPPCRDSNVTAQKAIKEDCWPAPEVSANLNQLTLGDLGLNDFEENAIVAFLETLSDGYQSKQN